MNDETRGMFGAAQFRKMKSNAYFVTVARGGIHDEGALAEALEAGEIAGAGLDVWMREPPPIDHLLLKFNDVLASPHIAAVTHESARKAIGGRSRTVAGNPKRQAPDPLHQPCGLAKVHRTVRVDHGPLR
ncbi:MAG: NAD(P)-dependent oxidoreductase, partial [Verrucomicrobiia bacterium]